MVRRERIVSSSDIRKDNLSPAIFKGVPKRIVQKVVCYPVRSLRKSFGQIRDICRGEISDTWGNELAEDCGIPLHGNLAVLMRIRIIPPLLPFRHLFNREASGGRL